MIMFKILLQHIFKVLYSSLSHKQLPHLHPTFLMIQKNPKPQSMTHILDLRRVYSPNMPEIKEIINQKQSDRKSIITYSLLLKILHPSSYGLSLPNRIYLLIQSLVFKSPITFIDEAYVLESGIAIFKVPPKIMCSPRQQNNSAKFQYQDERIVQDKINTSRNKGQKSQLDLYRFVKRKRSEAVRRNMKYIIGTPYGATLLKTGQIWKAVKNKSMSKIIQYTSLLQKFLALWDDSAKSKILCLKEEHQFLLHNLLNIVLNGSNYLVEDIQFSIIELIRRDMIWVLSNNISYLCIAPSSEKNFTSVELAQINIRGFVVLHFSEAQQIWSFQKAEYTFEEHSCQKTDQRSMEEFSVWRLKKQLDREQNLVRVDCGKNYYLCHHQKMTLCQAQSWT